MDQKHPRGMDGVRNADGAFPVAGFIRILCRSCPRPWPPAGEMR